MIKSLGTLDIIVVIGLILFIIGASMYAARKKKSADEYFLGSFCNQIWNEDTKGAEIIEQDWACPYDGP